MAANISNIVDWSDCGLLGTWKKLAGGRIEVLEPATGQVLATTGKANAEDIREASALAATVQTGWAALPYQARAAIFRKAAGFLVENRDAYSEWIVR